MDRTLRTARWGLAAAVAASLGFGTTQAFAGTDAAPRVRACSADECMQRCLDLGRPGGTCVQDPRAPGGFRCVCTI